MTTREQRATAEALDEVARIVVRRAAGLGEINLTAAMVLAALEASGPCRLTELASYAGVSQPTMTVLVARLQRRAAVAREPDPADRRAVLVAITASGRELLHRRRTARTELLTGLIDTLEPAEQRALVAAGPALRRLIAAAQPSPER